MDFIIYLKQVNMNEMPLDTNALLSVYRILFIQELCDYIPSSDEAYQKYMAKRI